MITKIEGDLLTVCCFKGRGLRAIAPAIYRIARDNGLTAIEFWTRRPALARMLARFGFQAEETAYRCQVTPA